jgi:glycosyltransferase involved in cell wall biosynthesis
MSRPAERRLPAPGGLSAQWRAEAQLRQREALPAGPTVVSCRAPLGAGGLGRHTQEILDALERGGSSADCISGSSRSRQHGGDPRHALGLPYLTRILRAMPALPVSAGVRTRASMVEWDEYAARRLPAAAKHLIAFNSQALAQLRAARRLGYESAGLISANPHLRRLLRQHRLAQTRYPLESSWASRLLERNLAEYRSADTVYVASRYIRESFLEEGFADERIVDFPLTPDPRYEPDPGAGEPRSPAAGAPSASGGRFEIVYVGSLSVHKGVPLLIDALARLPRLELGLRLVGGWGSPGMRRFLERARARDGRISIAPGDPLAPLRTAALCVHPAYEDGFGYAPAEALAAGVPTIVSEDTGMKELIDPGRTGVVLGTGDLDALTEAIEAAYRGELLTGTDQHG